MAAVTLNLKAVKVRRMDFINFQDGTMFGGPSIIIFLAALRSLLTKVASLLASLIKGLVLRKIAHGVKINKKEKANK